MLHLPCGRERCVPPLLGVGGYCNWIESNFPRSHTSAVQGEGVDVLAIDMNGLIHSQLRHHALAMIMKQLVAVLRFARPSSSVLLAFDGPAPLAKMITQRQRRAKSSRGWSSLDAAKPSPLHATPGTSFMARAEAAVLYVCYSELGSARGRRLSFYLSGADVPGEGEVKILDWLMTCERPRKTNPTVCVVGGDGDLVLQALTLRRWEASVLRDLPRGKRRCSLISIDSLRAQMEGAVAEMATSLSLPVPAVTLEAGVVTATRRIVSAWPPALQVLEASFDRLWSAYNALRAHPSTGGQTLLAPEARSFNWGLLAALFQIVRDSHLLAKAEAARLLEAGASPKEIKAATAGVGLDPSTLHNLLERAVGEEMGGDATLSASAGEFEGKLPRNDVGEYLDADGICPDVGWRYRASHAPRAHHISAYASWQRTGGGEGLTAPNGGGGSIPSPLMCAVVLPRAVATDLAPSEIAAELKEGGILSFLEPSMERRGDSGETEYARLLEAVRLLPPHAVSPRSRRLAEAPAWLTLSRRRVTSRREPLQSDGGGSEQGGEWSQ
ncbi:MAG: hypothetical protein SGPRY_001820, partial [Prymnesium sp.]